MGTIQARDFPEVAGLFADYPWNYMPATMLEGHLGEVRTNADGPPAFADLALPAVKLHILGGDSEHPAVANYLRQIPAFSGLMFSGDAWRPAIESALEERFVALTRYAFNSENLDVELLTAFTQELSADFRVAPTDLHLAKQLFASRNFADQVKNYGSPEDFVTRGFGFCVLKENEIASSAGTFAHCAAGIEIQIDTKPKFRKQGLATAVGAHLMLESLARGLDPNWDAADKRSGHLACKLGYTPQGDYPFYVYVKHGSIMLLRRIIHRLRGRKS